MKKKVINHEKEEGKYAYCIIPNNGNSISFGKVGFENSEVYTISYKDVSAVVSDTPLTEYQPTEENIKTHTEVVNLVMKSYPLIPMAFGMAFKNKEMLFSVFERGYEAIKQILTLVDNKIELGVKIILAKELAELLNNGGKNELAFKFFTLLKTKSSEAVNDNLFSERLLLNASFLVDKNQVEEFSKEVDNIQKMLTSKIQYTGPWPPYNFAKISIGKGE